METCHECSDRLCPSRTAFPERRPEGFHCPAAAHRWRTEPIAYRKQNGGDYEIPALTLRPEVAPGAEGLYIHVIGSDG